MSQVLRIDPIRCDGYGLCAEILPELISLDDWGYPIVAGGPIPAHLLGQARRATDACPVLALRLQRLASEGTAHPASSRHAELHAEPAAPARRTRAA